MIQILGAKRVFILTILACAAVALGALVYGVTIPGSAQAKTDLQALEGRISTRRQELDGIRGEIERFSAQKDQFGELQKMGFFSSQDRILARAKFDELRALSRILTAKYKIDQATYETNEQIAKAGHVILKSSVTMGLEAIDDLDIYRLLYLLDSAFPGHAAVESLKITKTTDVTQALLRQIGNGIPSPIVKGELTFVWRTVLPESKAGAVIKSDQDQGQGM
jgi:hypothetical protein